MTDCWCCLDAATVLQMQRKYEAADARAAQAAAELTELQAKLSKAEDEMLALEGQVSILDSELAKYTP